MKNAENTHAGKASAAASHHCPTPAAANGNDFYSADELIAENRRRNEALASPYDPITGLGCLGERTALLMSPKSRMVMAPGEVHGCVAKACTEVWVPVAML